MPLTMRGCCGGEQRKTRELVDAESKSRHNACTSVEAVSLECKEDGR
jgi:hypothetical protein